MERETKEVTSQTFVIVTTERYPEIWRLRKVTWALGRHKGRLASTVKIQVKSKLDKLASLSETLPALSRPFGNLTLIST